MARKKENTFLLVSLDESKVRRLATVINNDVCRKILELLSQGNLTETEIAEKLSIPLSTVHYNLQQLLESSLVSADEYHYSEKGREVNHYSLANKYVIIAPKVTESLAQKLKRVLPVIGFSVVAAGFLQLFGRQPMQITNTITRTITKTLSQPILIEKAAQPLAGMGEAATSVLTNATNMSIDIAATSAAQVSQYFNPAAWFLAGAILAVILFLVVDVVREKMR